MPRVWEHESGWIAAPGVPLYRQATEHDCGPTALAMVLVHHQSSIGRAEVLARFPADTRASAKELREVALRYGFSAFVVSGTLPDIAHELAQHRPVIVGMAKPTATGAVAHYEVVVALHVDSQRIVTLDPAEGWRQNTLTGFMKEWLPTGSVLLVVIPPVSSSSSSTTPQ